MLWALLLLGIIAAPLVAAAVALAVGSARPGLAGRTVVGVAAATFLAAAVLAVRVAVDGPVSALALTADRLTVVVLLLVTGLTLVVTAYARRYLEGDPAAHRLLAAAGLLASATAAVASAGTLVGLAAAWTVSGVALCLLLACSPALPGAGDALRRTATSFAIGDLALWTAVLLVVARTGDPRLADLGSADGPLSGPSADAVAVLLVVAALARSAQLPFVRWLPATVAAPTPVSALLHAGVVNAGGLLLVRAAPVIGDSGWAGHLAFAAGAATAVYGAALVLTATDVKGSLALSTTAQMGFMVMACAVGAWTAAVVHLVAHGMYKAALFLGSGSAVRAVQQERRAPTAPPGSRTGSSARTAVALAVPALVLPALVLAAAQALGIGRTSGPADTAVVLAFAWASGAALVWGWLGRDPSLRGLGWAAGVLVLAMPAYLLVIGAVAGFVQPAIAGTAAALPSPALLVLPVVAMVALTALRVLARRTSGPHPSGAPTAWLRRLDARLYVWSLTAGSAHRSPLSLPRIGAGSVHRSSWPVTPRPAESPQGARS